MSDLAGKKILLLQQRAWAVNIGHELAKKMQSEGCKIAAITLKKSTDVFIRQQTDVVYEKIINHDEFMGAPHRLLTSEAPSLLDICRELKIDSIWPYIAAHRNFVRTYGEKFYYSYRQNVSDEHIVAYIRAFYSSVKKLFSEFKPDCIVSANFVSFPHILINLYARSLNIPMIAVTDSKVKGYNIFVRDFYESSGAFFNRLAELKKDVSSPSETLAKQYIADFRSNFKQPEALAQFIAQQNSLWHSIKNFISPWVHIVRWYLKSDNSDYNPALGPTIDHRPPRIILRDYWRFWFNSRFVKNFGYHPIENVGKYIYFPLQFQPESSIDVMAPFFNNQLEVARLVAQSMPDDYTLVVKEHPAMVGNRSPNFYKKLSRTVNLKLVDYRISSKDVLKNAAMVISPNSTTLAEAAILKIPAIQLGNLGVTLELPNVQKHTDFTTLSSKIKEVLNSSLDTPEYEKKLENFVSAVYDTGFPATQYQRAWQKGSVSQEDLQAIWGLFKEEITAVMQGK